MKLILMIMTKKVNFIPNADTSSSAMTCLLHLTSLCARYPLSFVSSAPNTVTLISFSEDTAVSYIFQILSHPRNSAVFLCCALKCLAEWQHVPMPLRLQIRDLVLSEVLYGNLRFRALHQSTVSSLGLLACVWNTHSKLEEIRSVTKFRVNLSTAKPRDAA